MEPTLSPRVGGSRGGAPVGAEKFSPRLRGPAPPGRVGGPRPLPHGSRGMQAGAAPALGVRRSGASLFVAHPADPSKRQGQLGRVFPQCEASAPALLRGSCARSPPVVSLLLHRWAGHHGGSGWPGVAPGGSLARIPAQVSAPPLGLRGSSPPASPPALVGGIVARSRCSGPLARWAVVGGLRRPRGRGCALCCRGIPCHDMVFCPVGHEHRGCGDCGCPAAGHRPRSGWVGCSSVCAGGQCLGEFLRLSPA